MSTWTNAQFKVGSKVISMSRQQQGTVTQIAALAIVGVPPMAIKPFHYQVSLADGSVFTLSEDDLLPLGPTTTT